MAEISLIVPVYNVEGFIRKCIESIVNQTLQNIEIIIVNDGTKDGSIRAIEDIVNQDERIVLINKKNGGLMSAWMTGVKAATSEYIGFVDSDDWIDLDYFEFLLKRIKENDADIVVGKYVSEYETKTIELYRGTEKMYEGKAEILDLLNSYFRGFSLKDNLITYCRWDKVYKRSLLLSNFQYLDSRISLGEDININCAVIPDCERILVLNKSPYYHYRQNATSIVNTFNPKQIDNIEYLYYALLNIADKKNLNTREINTFIGDMIYTQIRKLYDSKIELREKVKYLNYIVDKKFITIPMKSYAVVQVQLKKVFIGLFFKKKFRMCGVINIVYNQVKRIVH